MKNSALTRSVAVAAVATLGLTLTATAAHAAPATPSFDLDVPTAVRAGAAATPFSGHLSAPDGAQDVWVRTSITGADADDVTLEWKDAEGHWAVMPTTAVDGGVQVTFGDGDADGNGIKGFSVPAGYTADTDFRIAVDRDAEHGTLAWTSELVTGDAGTVVDSTAGTVAVAADPTFTMDVPHTLITGAAAAGFTGHLVALDGAQDVWVRTSITGAAADDVTLEWKDAEGHWAVMPTTAVDGGVQVTFGDGDADGNGVRGFSVPAGYTADTDFRIAVDGDAGPGSLTWVSELVTGDAGTVLRSTTGTVEVDLPVAPKATFGARAETVVFGRDVRFTGTLLDVNHGGTALAGRAVTVFRQVGAGTPVAFAATTTDADGAFAVTVPGTESATYWAVSGDQTTAEVDITVSKRLSSVNVSRKHAARGQAVRFTGTAVGPELHQPVLLQRQRANGTWKKVAAAESNRAGAFTIRGPLPVGKHSYRVVAPGTGVVAGTSSKVFVVTVR